MDELKIWMRSFAIAACLVGVVGIVAFLFQKDGVGILLLTAFMAAVIRFWCLDD